MFGKTMTDGLGGSGPDPPQNRITFYGLGRGGGVRVRTVEPRSTVWGGSDEKM